MQPGRSFADHAAEAREKHEDQVMETECKIEEQGAAVVDGTEEEQRTHEASINEQLDALGAEAPAKCETDNPNQESESA
jgi:hypothetical protein